MLRPFSATRQRQLQLLSFRHPTSGARRAELANSPASRCTHRPEVVKSNSTQPDSQIREVPMADQAIEKYSDLFNKKAFANLGTLMSDGSPQVTPVWFDYDGHHIRVNSALGRVKDK